MRLNILNTREKQEILEKLEKQYGFDKELNQTFLKSSKDKIYIVSRDIARINLEEYKIDRIGNYFASLDSGGNLRLSIEGSQIVGPHATKNVREINDEEFKKWIAGESLESDENWSPFQIIKYGDDFIACGKVVDGKLKNYVPKSRRITSELA